MKSHIGKKGEAGTYFAMFFIALLLLSLLMSTVGTRIAIAQSQITPDNNALTYVNMMRFVSGTCFTYYDPALQKYYSGDIDISKFTQENLQKCYDIPSTALKDCFRLTLLDKDLVAVKMPLTTNNFDSFCAVNSQIKPVNIYDNGIIQRGYLKIEHN